MESLQYNLTECERAMRQRQRHDVIVTAEAKDVLPRNSEVTNLCIVMFAFYI